MKPAKFVRDAVLRRVYAACLFIRLAALFWAPALIATAQEKKPAADERFTRTETMVPMRDGTKLFTILQAPKQTSEPTPIILYRTPYGVQGRDDKMLDGYFKELVGDGYAFVFQDIRGRNLSDGHFVMTRPPRDPNDPKSVDEASDTYDTIEWLLKTVPNNNGRVGMLGISYPGWLTAVAMLDPHPALKAVSPQASPSDMYLGDDFHHNGAFRLSYGFEYVAMMETGKTSFRFQFDKHDTYEWYLRLGALSNINRFHFTDPRPTWNDFIAHPNYDAFWKNLSLEPRLKRVTAPTLNVAGWYDQEDFRGPLRIYELLERHDRESRNFLVVGPWNHGGWATGPGAELGKVKFDSDTGAYFRANVQRPFFARFLKDREAPIPEAHVFQTGANRWVSYDQWPPRDAAVRKLYLQSAGRLAFQPPTNAEPAFDEYTSDPANPVPYRPRPIRPTYPGKEWPEWMVQDQRFVHGRPDVVSYETEPLEEDLEVAGAMRVKLHASSSGTDCDWMVRLIDVYPEQLEKSPDMGGYQLLIAGEPVRARFRKSFEQPEPLTPGVVEPYTVELNWGHHRFRKGHKVMIQISSTWFPLIDRNPQKYLPNIYQAEDSDFQKAQQRIYRDAQHPSCIELDTIKQAE